MKNNTDKKEKPVNDYKNKRRVFSTSLDAPFVNNFFSMDDIRPILTKIFDGKRDCESCTNMLNNALKMAASFYPDIDRLAPSKADEKELLNAIENNLKQLNENMDILLNKYGYETLKHLPIDRQRAQTFLNDVRWIHGAIVTGLHNVGGRVARILYSPPTQSDKMKVMAMKEVLIFYNQTTQTCTIRYSSFGKYRARPILDNAVLSEYRLNYFEKNKIFIKNKKHVDQLNKMLILWGCTAPIVLPAEKKRGDNAFNGVKALIRNLIVVYEKVSNKKAADNFKHPKMHHSGSDYQGQFYDFCIAIFRLIDENYKKRYLNQSQHVNNSGGVQHIFSIDLYNDPRNSDQTKRNF